MRTLGGTNPSLAVVIPTCDRADLLREALESVLRQTRAPAEIIVVNNGPNAVDVGELAETRSVIRVIDIPIFAGAAQARNFGASLVTSEYVAFLDDDDLWEDTYLEEITDVILELAPDCLIGRLDELRGGVIQPFKNADGCLTLGEMFLNNPGVTGSSTVVRRSAFFDVSGYDPTLPTGEDKALIIELLLRGHRVVAAPQAGAILRQHSGDRLSTVARMAETKRIFLDRYGKRMTQRQRRQVAGKMWYLRYKSGHGIVAACRFLLISGILKVTGRWTGLAAPFTNYRGNRL